MIEASLLTNGFEIIEDFLTPERLREFDQAFHHLDTSKAAGIRNAEKKFPLIKSFLNSQEFSQASSQYIDNSYQLVRAILFNKTEKSNWYVTWHQDRTVALSKKIDNDDWGPWSSKDDILHVQPPLEVLESMLTLRIHIDASNEENGCLKVIPGSHRHGILSEEKISTLVQEKTPYICKAKAGSALIMRPHLLHASSKATSPSRRRILHLEFSNFVLPKGVDWA